MLESSKKNGIPKEIIKEMWEVFYKRDRIPVRKWNQHMHWFLTLEAPFKTHYKNKSFLYWYQKEQTRHFIHFFKKEQFSCFNG